MESVRSARCGRSAWVEEFLQRHHLDHAALVVLGRDEPLVEHFVRGHRRIPAVLRPSGGFAAAEDRKDGSCEQADGGDDYEGQAPQNH